MTWIHALILLVVWRSESFSSYRMCQTGYRHSCQFAKSKATESIEDKEVASITNREGNGNATKLEKKRKGPIFSGLPRPLASLADSSTSEKCTEEEIMLWDLDFTIYGQPMPLQRHMLSAGHMYNPSKPLQREFASVANQFLRIQLATETTITHESEISLQPLAEPIEVHLAFHFARPKSHFRTGKFSSQLKDSAPHWHAGRRDLVRE
jgi:hypothetical protein